MIQFLIKLLISSGIIIIVSEISKKDTLMGGIIVSIPLVSVLSMVWLYLETKNVENVSALSTSILWLIIPSLTLFIVLPILIKSGINFFISMGISILITMGCYWIMIIILGKFGIKL
tara:strand:+ start:4517 stop:4867 length:351 start_codon:yes stop_codon:yes gene_type:complete